MNGKMMRKVVIVALAVAPLLVGAQEREASEKETIEILLKSVSSLIDEQKKMQLEIESFKKNRTITAAIIDKEEQTINNKSKHLIISTCYANAREFPNLNSRIKNVYRLGAIIEGIGVDNKWYKTSEDYYIHKSVIKEFDNNKQIKTQADTNIKCKRVGSKAENLEDNKVILGKGDLVTVYNTPVIESRWYKSQSAFLHINRG